MVEEGRRIDRPLSDMIGALRRHTRLLKEYRRRAFDDMDRDYWGEVATKLRLLLLPAPAERQHDASGRVARRNKALLRLLQERAGLTRKLGGDVFGGTSLDDFLSQGFMLHRDGERLGVMSNAELINVWATQHGAAHEDWAFTETFALLHPRGDAETDLLAVAVTRIVLIADTTIEACEGLLAVMGGEARDGPTQ